MGSAGVGVRRGGGRRGEVHRGGVRRGEVRAGEVRRGEVRAGEVRVDEVRAFEIRAGEVRFGKVGVGEVYAAEANPPAVVFDVPPPNDGDGGLDVGTRGRLRRGRFERARGRCRPRQWLTGVLADARGQDLHHGGVVFRGVIGDPFQGVDAADGHVDCGGAKLFDRLGIAVGELSIECGVQRTANVSVGGLDSCRVRVSRSANCICIGGLGRFDSCRVRAKRSANCLCIGGLGRFDGFPVGRARDLVTHDRHCYGASHGHESRGGADES
jgi:hypothetical protein